MSSGPPLARPPLSSRMTQIIPGFLPNIKSQHLEREFSPLLAEVASCEGGEEWRGEGVDIMLHLSDTFLTHVLTSSPMNDNQTKTSEL